MDALDRTFQHLIHTIQARYPVYLTQPFDVAELYQNILPYRHHRRELGLDTNLDYELVLLQLFSGARDYLIVDEEMRERLGRELASANPDPGAFREFSTSQVALSPAAVRRFQTGGVGASEPVLAGATQAVSGDGSQRVSARSVAPAAAPPTKPAPPAPKPAVPAPKPAMSAPKPSTPTPTLADASPATASSLAAQPAPRRAPVNSTATTGPRSVAIPSTSRATQTIVPQTGEICRYCNGALPTGRRITFCPHCGQNLTVVNCLACGTELELGWKFCTTCGRPVSQS